MSSEMTLDALHAELQRREIVLQMDGPKLIAIDPYQRLSPALKASIQNAKGCTDGDSKARLCGSESTSE